MVVFGTGIRNLVSRTTWVVSARHTDTPIATPTGDRPIADVRVNDWVYSVDGNSVRAVRVARVIRRPVRNHHVIRVTTTEGSSARN